MSLEELQKRAEALGINVNDFKKSDDSYDEGKLLTVVEEREEKARKAKDPEYLESELKKVISQRDEAKKDLRSLKSQVEELMKKTQTAVSTEEYTSLKKQLDELTTYKKQVDEEEEKKKLEKADEAEKAKIRFQKELDAFRVDMEKQLNSTKEELEKHRKEITDRDERIQKLNLHRLENEIVEHATKYKAFKPRQIIRLLKDEFVYDSTVDKFIKEIRDGKGKIVDELSVEDVVKKFLEDPENDNLVEGREPSTVTMSSISSSSGSSRLVIPSKDEKEKAEDMGLSVEDYRKVEATRLEKLKRVEESRRKK